MRTILPSTAIFESHDDLQTSALVTGAKLSGFWMVGALMSMVAAFAQHSLAGSEPNLPGLVGVQFGKPDLRDKQRAVLLTTLDQSWTKADDHGREWSARWQGYLIAPASGEVMIHAESDKHLEIRLGDRKIVELNAGDKPRAVPVSMQLGQTYAIEVTFINKQGYDNSLSIKWSWAGQDKVSISVSNLCHTVEQERAVNWPAASSVSSAEAKPKPNQ